MKLTIAEAESRDTGGLCALVRHEAESTATLMKKDERILMWSWETNDARKADNAERENMK